MDKHRDKELVELLNKLLYPLTPEVHRDYLFNLITYHRNTNKTIKEVLQDELRAMEEMDKEGTL